MSVVTMVNGKVEIMSNVCTVVSCLSGCSGNKQVDTYKNKYNSLNFLNLSEKISQKSGTS